MLLCWSAGINSWAACRCCMQGRDDDCEQSAFWSHSYSNSLELSLHPFCMLLLSRLGICHEAQKVSHPLST